MRESWTISTVPGSALRSNRVRIEIVAPGFETLVFEVNVRPSQTVRYRGDMLRMVP